MLVFLFSVGVGVLLIVLGVPLARRKVAPNGWYGFRVGRALESDRAWYDANAASGRWLAIAGAALMVSSTLLFALNVNGAVAAMLNSVVGVVGILAAVAAGFAGMSADDFR